MAKVNPTYARLAAGYLFPEIARRTREFVAQHPGVQIMRLGIGDTTEELPQAIIKGLHKAVDKLASRETYVGYGDGEGNLDLREAIARDYQRYGVEIAADEVFISDGAKPDSGNIQSLFAPDSVIAIQDPAYPVYVDSNVIAGRTGNKVDGFYQGLYYMPCNEENGFFPELPKEKVDLIYICSPNNPTGAVATKTQLAGFVDYALKNKAVIIFDAAYAAFIKDESLPRSIFEIPNAKKCALEINSFSKSAGFTGVRLGWSVIPKELDTEDAEPGKLNKMWNRRQNTLFNGAANIVQMGALEIFTEEGKRETQALVDYYMNNARVIRGGLESLGIKCYGGDNAPYIWLKTPNGLGSWEFFDKLITEANVVGTPGAGFGQSGEGFFRLSSFGHAENIVKAVESIKSNLKL